MVLNDLAYDADSIAGRKRETGCRIESNMATAIKY
jgi:hypothetical protein